ncbi:MAG TPA: FtsX-like permease family protein, partial [Phnomibacter sp.]|nr:FtsX-like permease family protein [Phnomibacter sp.]
DWLSIQNQTKLIVICVMIAVAVINLITCLLILVMERARMVGVLQSLGMSQAGIQQIFWYYAAYIAGCGIAIGLALSLGLLGLQQATGFITMDEATYYVRQMPVRIIGWQVLAVAAGSFVVCLLALRLPLYFVNRIQPVKVLRFS